jgi:hypothetical protein
MDHTKVIGERDDQGRVLRYPETSISGNPNYERPPTQICNLGGGRFCVLDLFPPRGFDTHQAVDDLRASLNPSPRAPASRGKRPDDGLEVENA